MDATPEEWRPVVGYQGIYEVSDRGRVRSLDRIVPGSYRTCRVRGRILRMHVAGKRYPQVRLCRPGHQIHRPVHQLVLEAFVGPRPEGMVACHWDDVHTNNHLSNLRWDTPENNVLDKSRNGRNYWSMQDKCAKGHDYTPENTRVKGNFRRCRKCANADAELRRRQKGITKRKRKVS